MKILNLTNNEISDIKFEVSKFPDGQQQVKIIPKFINPLNASKLTVQIKARLNNFKDLELIICTTKSLRELGFKKIHLYTPYFLGSRSDRKFEEGSNNYLKDVICPIINSLGFESVTVLDPHSDVLEACLNNFKKVDNLKLVSYVLENLYCNGNTKDHVTHVTKNPDFILISPDAGANKKIFKVAEQIGYTREIITCSKSRDEQGKLSKIQIPLHSYNGQDLIIIDDICDGGATFLRIAEKLQEITNSYHQFLKTNSKSKIYLIVTHGIFSKGLSELSKYFDGIYTTNSYQEHDQPLFAPSSERKLAKSLNVF